jgi:hypothetical protein
MEVLPVRLPEMELLYSQHSTARATLSPVISMTKWCCNTRPIAQLRQQQQQQQLKECGRQCLGLWG